MEEITYNREALIFQGNALVRSRQDELSLLETKLIRLAIAQIFNGNTDFKTYRCHVTDLAKFLDILPENIYRTMQETTKDLMKKNIFIKTGKDKNGNDNYKILHWIDYAEYKDGVIEFRLSEHLKPFLLGLKELFTVYSYGAIIDLPTTNAIRLYELLSSWKNSTPIEEKTQRISGIASNGNDIVMPIEYLRNFFNCVDKYPNVSDFIKRVIDPSVKGINERSKTQLTFRKVRSGRTITHIAFEICGEQAADESKEAKEMQEKFKHCEDIVKSIFDSYSAQTYDQRSMYDEW